MLKSLVPHRQVVFRSKKRYFKHKKKRANYVLKKCKGYIAWHKKWKIYLARCKKRRKSRKTPRTNFTVEEHKAYLARCKKRRKRRRRNKRWRRKFHFLKKYRRLLKRIYFRWASLFFHLVLFLFRYPTWDKLFLNIKNKVFPLFINMLFYFIFSSSLLYAIKIMRKRKFKKLFRKHKLKTISYRKRRSFRRRRKRFKQFVKALRRIGSLLYLGQFVLTVLFQKIKKPLTLAIERHHCLQFLYFLRRIFKKLFGYKLPINVCLGIRGKFGTGLTRTENRYYNITGNRQQLTRITLRRFSLKKNFTTKFGTCTSRLIILF